MAQSDSTTKRSHKAGAFDIRNFIGILLGLYGVILVLTGFIGTDDAELTRADGLNINLWAGFGLVLVSAGFLAWARWRPVVVPDDPDDLETDGDQEGAAGS